MRLRVAEFELNRPEHLHELVAYGPLLRLEHPGDLHRDGGGPDAPPRQVGERRAHQGYRVDAGMVVEVPVLFLDDEAFEAGGDLLRERPDAPDAVVGRERPEDEAVAVFDHRRIRFELRQGDNERCRHEEKEDAGDRERRQKERPPETRETPQQRGHGHGTRSLSSRPLTDLPGGALRRDYLSVSARNFTESAL